MGSVALAALAALLLAAATPVAAAGADTSGSPRLGVSRAQAVQGLLEDGDRRFVLRYGAALLHDDAEGLDGGRRRLRLLLSDGPLGHRWLEGVAPEFDLQDRARSGALRGVLLSLDPTAPEQVVITPLLPPPPGGSPMVSTLTLFRSGGPGTGPFTTFTFTNQRLRASLKHRQESPGEPAAAGLRSFSFQVDLPVQPESAVTAVVRGGPAVRATPQGRLALERAGSMARLDAAALARLRLQAPPGAAPLPVDLPDAQLLPLLRELADVQLRGLHGAELRLVVRGERAVLVLPSVEGGRSWITFRRQEGTWRLD